MALEGQGHFHIVYRGRASNKKDTQPPGLVGSEGKATDTGQRPIIEHPYSIQPALPALLRHI
jgi:hypothetical protein